MVNGALERLILFVLAVLVLSGSGLAVSEGRKSDLTLKERQALAQQFINKVPPNWLVEELVEETVRKAPKDQRESLKQQIIHRIDMGRVRQTHIKYLVKYFSVDELRALIRFYGNESGFMLYKKMHKFASRSARETFPLVLFAYKDGMKAQAEAEKEQYDY